MKTGNEVFEIFEQNEYSHLIALYNQTAISKGIENPETAIVAGYLLFRDMDLIAGANSGQDIEKKVIDIAQARGQYAGLIYDEEEWDFDEEGEPSMTADDGLPWVGFGDMWEVFNDMTNTLTEKGE